MNRFTRLPLLLCSLLLALVVGGPCGTDVVHAQVQRIVKVTPTVDGLMRKEDKATFDRFKAAEVNVLDYVPADPAVECGTQFQAAIVAAQYKTLRVPKRDYKVGVELRPLSRTRIIGEPGAKLVCTNAAAFDTVFDLEAVEYVEIAGLEIDGRLADWTGVVTQYKHGISLMDCSLGGPIILRNLYIHDNKGDAWYVAGTTGTGYSHNVYVENVHAKGSYRSNSSIVALGPKGLTQVNCIFEGALAGVVGAGQDLEANSVTNPIQNFRSYSCKYINNATNGWQMNNLIGDAADYMWAGITLDGDVSTGNGNYGFYSRDGERITYNNCHSLSNTWHGLIALGTSKYVKIKGGRYNKNGLRGISFDGTSGTSTAEGCTVENAEVLDNSQTTANAQDGIFVGDTWAAAGAVGFRFVNNDVYNTGGGVTQRFGLRTSSFMPQTTIIGNRLSPNASGATVLNDAVATRECWSNQGVTNYTANALTLTTAPTVPDLNLNDVSGQTVSLRMRQGALDKFVWNLVSSAGAPTMSLDTYNDAGSFAQRSMLITRATGDVLFDQNVSVSKVLSVTGAGGIATNFGGLRATNAATPTATGDLATKGYTDSIAQGIAYKAPVRAGTAAALPANTRTGNVLTASANGVLAAVDTVTLIVGDRVLVQNEAAGANNGIYDVTSVGSAGTPWVMTRSADADVSAEVTAGMYTFVTAGTANINKGFSLLTANPITLNTTALTFGQTSGGGGGGGGTVTSVALTMPPEFAIAGSPVTLAGTLATTWNTTAANTVLAGPTSGGAAVPSLRALVAADIPVHTVAQADVTGLVAALGTKAVLSGGNVLTGGQQLVQVNTAAQRMQVRATAAALGPIFEIISSAATPVGQLDDDGDATFAGRLALGGAALVAGTPITANGTGANVAYLTSSVAAGINGGAFLNLHVDNLPAGEDHLVGGIKVGDPNNNHRMIAAVATEGWNDGVASGFQTILYTGTQNGTPDREAMRLHPLDGATIVGNLTVQGNLTANTLAGSGAGLTTLNGTQVTTGTVADARLSANVALKDGTNTWTQNQTFNGASTSAVAITTTGGITAGNALTVTAGNATITAGDLAVSAGKATINKRLAVGVGSVAYAATITPNVDNYNILNVGELTGPVTFNAPTGTPVDGQMLRLRIDQDATGRAITFNAIYAFGTDLLETDCVETANAKYEVTFTYHAGDTKYRATGLVRGF